MSADGPGAGTPGGFIRWTVTDPNGNSAACADTTLSGGGVALCTVTDAIAGTYRASAEFIDTDGNYQHSSSNGDSVVVSPQTIVQAAPFGATVTCAGADNFVAQLSPSTFDGDAVVYVTVQSSPDLLVSRTGEVTTTSRHLAPGNYVVTGTDSDASGDFGTWTFTLTVTANLTTQLTLVPSHFGPADVGSSVVFTAHVAPSAPSPALTGSVSFYENGTAIAACSHETTTNDTAACTVTFPDAGAVPVSAVYGNDAAFSGSSAVVVEYVARGSTSLTLSPTSPVVEGANVTYHAVVTETRGSGPLTGEVTFTLDGRKLTGCSDVPLSVGDGAACTVLLAQPGSVQIEAAYGGDPNFDGSSATLTQEVSCTLSINTTQLASAADGEDGYSQTLSATGGGTPVPLGRHGGDAARRTHAQSAHGGHQRGPPAQRGERELHRAGHRRQRKHRDEGTLHRPGRPPVVHVRRLGPLRRRLSLRLPGDVLRLEGPRTGWIRRPPQGRHVRRDHGKVLRDSRRRFEGHLQLHGDGVRRRRLDRAALHLHRRRVTLESTVRGLEAGIGAHSSSPATRPQPAPRTT